MSYQLQILHLEDDPNDATLIEALLHKAGIEAEIQNVQSREDFVAALEQGPYDLILSDFSMPGFDGLSALKLAAEKLPEVPYLFVSGTLGEELAIDALKKGATDYVLKQRLGRLGPAVQRAISEAEERRALRRAEEAMVESEHKYRQLFECLGEAALLADTASGRIIDTNRQAEVLFGRPRNEIVGSRQSDLMRGATLEECRQRFASSQSEGARVTFEGVVRSKDGAAISVAVTASPLLLHGRRLMLGLFRDLTGMKRAEAEIQMLREELAQRQLEQ